MSETNSNRNQLKGGISPRYGDVVRAEPSPDWPAGRNGWITKVLADNHPRHPGKVIVWWSERMRKGHRSSRMFADGLELVRCQKCRDDNTVAVSDGQGGVEYDICPRCCRTDGAVPDSAYEIAMSEIEF